MQVCVCERELLQGAKVCRALVIAAGCKCVGGSLSVEGLLQGRSLHMHCHIPGNPGRRHGAQIDLAALCRGRPSPDIGREDTGFLVAWCACGACTAGRPAECPSRSCVIEATEGRWITWEQCNHACLIALQTMLIMPLNLHLSATYLLLSNRGTRNCRRVCRLPSKMGLSRFRR